MSDVTTSVYLVTAHGRQLLHGSPDESLLEVLARNQVPWSGVSVYGISGARAQGTLISGLERKLSEFAEWQELHLYFNRNLNPFLLQFSDIRVVEAAEKGAESTEYFYQDLDNANSRSDLYLKKLSPEECRSIVADRVSEMISESIPPGSKMVVGVSGGGDSNALLHALAALKDRGVDLQVCPVIIKGIPDWDSGVPRARALAETYGFDLTVVEEPEVQSLLGMTVEQGSLIDRFERIFVGDDFEFVGTLLIRLALMRKAKELGTKYIATGINLEDILCESLYRVSTGAKPAPFPVREIGDVELLFPLWRCPKKIIDGCFPKYSLENYNARYPGFSLGRNLYYSVVYTLQSRYPAYAEQLVQGFSKLSKDDPVTYHFDDALGFHVERFVPLPLREKFRRMRGMSSLS